MAHTQDRFRARRNLTRLALWHFVQLGALPMGGCGADAPREHPHAVHAAQTPQARATLWANGDFEADPVGTTPPSGWTTTNYINGGLSGAAMAPPQSLAALNLTAPGGAVNETFTVGGAAGTQIDPDLGPGEGFRFPKYGMRAVRLNYLDKKARGQNKNVSAMAQQMVVGAGDVDATDAQIHIRFAIAPVLENPSHSFSDQPYYYIELRNVTQNTSLYRSFNVAGQAGVPWHTTSSVVTGNATQWIDWQLVDIAPNPSQLAVGDAVQLIAVAGGCAPGGHFGRLYLDGLGASIPGPYASATGPQAASPSQTITYILRYANGGTDPAIGAHLTMAMPPQTTLASLPAANCSIDGTGQNVSCPLGTLAPGASGSLAWRVTLASGATGSITNGTYSLCTVNGGCLLGMPTTLQVLQPATAYAEVSVTPATLATAAAPGALVQMGFTVANNGPTDLPAATVRVVATAAAGLVNVTWTCSPAPAAGNAAPVASCGVAAGSGSILARPALPVGTQVTYVLQGTLAAAAPSIVTQALTATVLGNVTDPNPADTVGVTQVSVGLPHTLAVTKAQNPNLGTIFVQPAALACGPDCATASGQIADGVTVQLTARPVAGATFAGWVGDCSACTGPVCTLTMASDLQAGAAFVPAASAGAPAAIAAYAGAGQTAAINTPFAANLTVLVTDANNLPVPQSTVTFAVPARGPGGVLGATSAVTDAMGLAQASIVANAMPGKFAVTATVGDWQTSFALMNAGPAKTLQYIFGGTSDSPQVAPVSGAFASQLVARVLDASGAPVPHAAVRFIAPIAPAAPGATLSPIAAVADNGGYVRTSAVANAYPGTFPVAVISPDVATPLTFTLQTTVASPAAVYAVSGTPQAAPPGAAFAQPLTLVVADGSGNPLPGVHVTVAAPKSGASAALSVAPATDINGMAQVVASANGVPGQYTLTVSAGTGAQKAQFVLLNNGTRYLAVQAGNAQAAPQGQAMPQPLVVQVTDQAGVAVAGVPVAFAAPTSGPSGKLAAAFALTDASGNATTAVAAGAVPGSYIVLASAAGAAQPATFNLTNGAGPAASLVVVAGSNQSAAATAPYPQALAVRAIDAVGNPVAGVGVNFATSPGLRAATLAPPSAITDASGTASTTASAGTSPGPVTVVATLAGDSSVRATLNLQQLSGSPAQLVAVFGQGQLAPITAPFPSLLGVQVLDAWANPVPGVRVTFSAPSAGPSATLSAPQAVTQVDGTATVKLLANKVTGTFCVRASVAGLDAVASFDLTNVPGAPAVLRAMSGDQQAQQVQADVAMPWTVAVADLAGNPVAGVPVSFVSPEQGPGVYLEGKTAITDATGTAAMLGTANEVAGTYKVQASVVGAIAVQFAVTNFAGPAVGLQAVSGEGQQAPPQQFFAQPLVVRALDKFGNAAAFVDVVWTAPAVGPTCMPVPALAPTGPDGQMTVSCTAGPQAGSFALIASLAGDVESSSDITDDSNKHAPSLQRANFNARPRNLPGFGLQATFVLTVVPGPAAKIAAISGGTQDTTVTQTFAAPFVVAVADACGNPVSGTNVSFSAPSMGASAQATAMQVVTDANGMAATDATANTVAGSYVLWARVEGAPGPAAFEVVNLAGPAAAVEAVLGSPQTVVVLQPFGQPCQALVTDVYGNPVAGAQVTFRAPGDGATARLDDAVVATDASGMAAVLPTASSVAGHYALAAQLISGGAQASFVLKNMAGAPVSIVVISGDGQQVGVNTPLSAPLVARVDDAGGNPVPQVPVWASVPASGSTFVPAAPSLSTNAQGLVGLMGTANAVVGDYTVSLQLSPDSGDNPTDSDEGTGIGGAPTSANFAISNVSGEGVRLQVVGGGGQTVAVGQPLADPLTVQLSDAGGQLIAGAKLTFVALLGPASTALALDTRSAVTDALGIARVQATAGRVPGTFSVVATLGAQPQAQATAITTVLAGPPVALVVDPHTATQAATVATAFAMPLRACVTDAFGNAVIGADVHFAAPQAAATAALATADVITDPGGCAQATAWASVKAGAYAVSATVGLPGGPSAAFALRNLAGPPHELVTVVGASEQAMVGTPFAVPLQVRLRDTQQNPVPWVTILYSAPSASGAAATAVLDNVAIVTDADGMAQVAATAGATAGKYLVSATYTSAMAPAIFTLQNVSGPLDHLVIDAGSAPQAAGLGEPMAHVLKVTAVDRGQNPVPGVAVQWQAPSGEPTASVLPLQQVTDATGSAQASVVAGSLAGDYNVVVTATAVPAAASSATASPTPAPCTASFTLANLGAAALTLRNVGPTQQGAEVGTPFAQPLAVQVVDELGSGIPDVVVTFGTPASGASATLAAATATATTDDDGVVSVQATANAQAGLYQVVASCPAAEAPLALSMRNDVAPAQRIAVASQATPQSTEAHQPFNAPLSVLVQDAFGNPVRNATVTFVVPAQEPSVMLSAYTVTTDAQGRASVAAVASSGTGAYEVEATATVADTNQTVTFALRNANTPPPTLRVISGGPQQAVATAPFAYPVAFAVRTSTGDALVDQPVTLTATPAGLPLPEAPLRTDANGYATVSLAAGRVPATYTLVANSPGAQGPATVVLTVMPVPALLTLALPDAPLAVGDTLLAQAQVSASTGSLSGQTIAFALDGQSLGLVPVQPDGTASLRTPPLASGRHTMAINLSESAPYAATQAAETFFVNDWAILGGGSCAQLPAVGAARGRPSAWPFVAMACLSLGVRWRARRRRGAR